VPSMDPHEQRSAGSPVMPSFASLRGPARRSPVDLLVPAEPPAASTPAAPAAPRPPEWSDLLHLAVHVTRWSLGVPLRGLRRLLGA
jgi:hypothetical protein